MVPLRNWITCGWFLLAAAAAVSAPAFPARKTLTAGNSVIEYSAGDEAFARDFAARVDHIFEPPSAAPPAPIELSFSQIAQQRDEYLGAICHYLHLAKPTPRMCKVFDDFPKTFEALSAVAATARIKLHNFQLWRGAELKARLEAGHVVRGISISRDGTGVDFSAPPDLKDLGDWFLPVMVSRRDVETGPALADKKISEVQELWSRMLLQWQPGRNEVHLFFHEVVEAALVENYLSSKDRRWFCEGVANYVSYKIIEDKFGSDIARRYYDLNAQLSQFADLRSSTHLEKWPSLETQQKEKHDDRNTWQGKANYALATEVIFNVATKHGPDFLPTLLAEVGKTPANKASIKTIYRAYQTLYGEDLRSYLPEKN